MSLLLPKHIADYLRVKTQEVEDTVLLAAMRRAGEMGPIFSHETAHYLCEKIKNPEKLFLEIIDPAFPLPEWHYRKVEFDSVCCAEIVQIPISGVTDLPPTAAEHLLVRGWVNGQTLLRNGELLRNKTLIEWKGFVSAEVQEIVRAINGKVSSRSSTAPRLWAKATQVEFRSESRVLKHGDSTLLRRLFADACLEGNRRWRFLALYRVLEHGYLDSLFQGLSKRFFQEPKDALQDAQKALGNEIEQFIHLVENNHLIQVFDDIWILTELLVSTGNRFALLLQNAANARGQAEAYKRGVTVCYQTRCSIVHAGSISLVYDRIPGSEEVLDEFIPELERGISSFLGINTSM